jgi:hypothetical protein
MNDIQYKLIKALAELADDIKKEIMARIEKYGYNPRAGRNTLVGSDLEKSVDVKVVSDNELVFEIADYYEFVVRGWKRTGRYPGTMRKFIENLTQWVRKNGIQSSNRTENQIVWAIVKSIFMRGIEPRPFINWDENDDPSVVLPFLDDYFDRWADEVFNKITEELDKYFNT